MLTVTKQTESRQPLQAYHLGRAHPRAREVAEHYALILKRFGKTNEAAEIRVRFDLDGG